MKKWLIVKSAGIMKRKSVTIASILIVTWMIIKLARENPGIDSGDESAFLKKFIHIVLLL